MVPKGLFPKPFTSENFSPYGTVVQPKDNGPMVVANGGTATKYLGVSESVNNYSKSSTPSFKATWNFFSTKPSVVPADEDSPAFQIKVLERHPYTTQTFIPLCRDAEEDSYLVAVAPDAPDGLPDWDHVEIFVAKGYQGVTYAAGVWHAPMVTIGKETMLAAFNYENGVGDDDCQVQSAPFPLNAYVKRN
ncbi:ureidoglycolate hydrolase [Schizosaccharomyces cryophilus OY26]|uniref:Ureidoglycolate hydrolase n=1 Tax=Schizosaccharomyces cryophilus (strain OY26 / ATCC MYA-4695 / CBS 11777 / NBRC 106824 / NRRL Y48691) TaxID=653667 RepID=S9VZ35_SCHCR|nr:ureidoglycolate hydrolase [Schizosaccharomyces cryophilus OY26]EPY51469.1 ureidoglycolate hydrolase [Schizosaccharomyces cryophilus OY26]